MAGTSRTAKPRARQAERKARPQASRFARGAAMVRWRYRLAMICCALLGGGLLWHIAALQVLPDNERGYQFLQSQGQARALRTETVNASRGVITDRHGEPLAVSSPVTSIAANPEILADAPQHWERLAAALDLDPSRLAERIGRYEDREFMYLRRHLAPTAAREVLALELPGVFARREYQRFYPTGEVSAHLIGFTDIDDVGQEGLELAYEDWLQGDAGAKEVLKDRRGRTVDDVRLIQAAQPGKDLALSVDLRLQYMAYRALKRAVARHEAVSGSAVILDSRSGEVLAMVNQPSFNPNNRQQVPPAAVRNRAMTDVFEPGSTVKPLTVLAALESGRYEPDTEVDTSPGYLRVPGKVFYDFRNYGLMDVTRIITKSSNVGISKIALDLPPVAIRNVYFRAGLGQSTGSGFPGESTGKLPDHTPWSPVERATFAFGHGLQVTTTQLAQAYGVIANGGIRRPLSLLKLSRDSGAGERVIAEEASSQVLDMMETVLEPEGTATRASLNAYSAAGKTGTARKVEADGYSYDAAFAVFAGIAPAEQPRIAVSVVINEPRGNLSGGGEVAAPVFAEIAENALRILQIAPDKESVNQFTEAAERDRDGEPLS